MAAQLVYRFDYLGPKARGRVFIHGYATQAVAYSGYPVPIWYRGDDIKDGHFTLSHNETTIHIDGTIGRWVDVQCLNTYNAIMLFVLQLIETPPPFPIPPPPGPTPPRPHLPATVPVASPDSSVQIWHDEQGRIQAVGQSMLGERCVPVACTGQGVLITTVGDLPLNKLAETHFVDRAHAKLTKR